MKTDPIIIDGVAGPVVVTLPTFFGTHALLVGGQPAPRIRRRRYALPTTTGGTVEALLRTGFADPYPTVEVNGARFRTGPQTPVALRVLTLLPLLLVPIGGCLGGLIGALGFIANVTVARTRIPSAAKALSMIGVSAVALVAWVAVVAVADAALNLS